MDGCGSKMSSSEPKAVSAVRLLEDDILAVLYGAEYQRQSGVQFFRNDPSHNAKKRPMPRGRHITQKEASALFLLPLPPQPEIVISPQQ
jgi:hypothetical protein